MYAGWNLSNFSGHILGVHQKFNRVAHNVSASFLPPSFPAIEDIIFDYVSLDYHELLMSASGDQSETILEDIIQNQKMVDESMSIFRITIMFFKFIFILKNFIFWR